MRRHLRRRLWLVPLCASAVALTTAVGPITSSSADTISTTACNRRTNNTVAKLLECIRTDDLWNQMKAQQAIADAHPTRAGTPRATPASLATRRRSTSPSSCSKLPVTT